MTVDVPCACTINLQVRYSRYLQASGPAGSSAQIKNDGAGWTTLTSSVPGTYRLQGRITGG